MSTDEHKCPECGATGFESKRGLQSHRGQVHDSVSKTKECPICSSTFETRGDREQIYCSRACSDSAREDQVEIECDCCGGHFKTWPSKAEAYDRKFCSKSCAGLAQRDRVEKTCAVCSDTFQVQRHKDDQAVVCSLECRSEYMSVKLSGQNGPNWQGGPDHIECSNCGRSFEAPSCEARRRTYCSQECMAAAYSQPDPEYGPGWDERKRERVRKRDGRECQGCGKAESRQIKQFGKRLAVHHITPASQIDNPSQRNSMENLVALCFSCHRTAESMAPLYPFAD